MKPIFLFLLLVFWQTKSVQAEFCPPQQDGALWIVAACDFGKDDATVAETIRRGEANAAAVDIETRRLLSVMSLAGATTFDLATEPQIWMFETTTIFTLGESNGVIGGYYPKSQAEEDAEIALIHALYETSGPEVQEVLAFVQMMVENRGGELLVGLGPEVFLFPFAASKEMHCRWADVRLPDFAILGSLNHLTSDGLAEGVGWEKSPRDCAEIVG
jgi:hypothetical protein